MAYMRGDYYVWTDESGLHIWAADGYDGWDETIWACEEEEEGPRRPDRLNASGVSIPQSVADEYVVMRLAEMLLEGSVGEAIDRAVATCDGRVLEKNAQALTNALSSIRVVPPDPL